MSAPRSLSRTVAGALAVTALLAPAAAASPAPEPGGNREIAIRDLQPTVTRTIDNDGFDVGSAAAGAGGAAGLVLLTLGGTSVLVRRRHHVAG